MVRAIIGLLLLLGFASLAQAQSGPAEDSIYGTPSEARWSPFFAVLPGCDDSGVLSTISSRFDETENTFWGGAHAIGAFERVREIGFRSNGLSYIPRRYCVARAAMVDPRVMTPDRTRMRTVIYAIGANSGIIGVSWGVEWCVVGLDRQLAYAPDCLVLRPILERWIGEYKQLGAAYGLKARY
jgi:hypothetical protein